MNAWSSIASVASASAASVASAASSEDDPAASSGAGCDSSSYIGLVNDDEASAASSAPSAAPSPPPPPGQFDLAAKLRQTLKDKSAERDRAAHRVAAETAALGHLVKGAPRRPREARAVLQQRARKLERDRTSRSLPLSQEKALIRQIDAVQKQVRLHDAAEAHQASVRAKRAEIESAREAHRLLGVQLSEIRTALSKVELGKRLGCLPSEVVSREVDCPMHLLAWVAGKDGTNVRDIEERASVNIEVDRIRGKVRVRGSEGAVAEATALLENFTKAIDEVVQAPPELISYLLANRSAVLDRIKGDNADVRIDVLSTRVQLRGHPDRVKKARSDIEGLGVVSRTRLLVGREAALVSGRIDGLSAEHSVVIDTVRNGSPDGSSTLRIAGPPPSVDAALAEVDDLLRRHEEVEEHIVVDDLLKGELLGDSGRAIKEFQRSLSAAAASDAPGAGGVQLVFERSGAPGGGEGAGAAGRNRLAIRCDRCVMDRARSLVLKKIEEFSSNVLTIDVEPDMVPAIIGKRGATIGELRKLGEGATVEADVGSGSIKVYSTDEGTRDEIKSRIERIVAENQVGYVPIDKENIGFVLGEPGREVREACTELGCTVSVSSDDTRLVVKGTNEQIEEASALLRDFLAKNAVADLDVDPDDEPLLFVRGSDSMVQKVEARHGVKASVRNGKLQVRGEAEKVGAAIDEVRQFLSGGGGVAVCRFNVPEEAIGGVIGKGGANIAKLESDFEGVLVHVPKEGNAISIRGPEEAVRGCRVRLITTIATTRVNESVEITPEKHAELAESDLIRRVSRFTTAQITLGETSIKIRGVSADVRDAKANINEHLTGVYHGYIDLEGSQFSRVSGTIAKDSSHFERVSLSTGAKVELDSSDCAVHISGKRSSVKKAKSAVMELLDFILPGQLRAAKVHRSLFKSVGDPGKLAEIASETGASISLDRDMSCVLIRSDDSKDCDGALEKVNSLIAECQKLTSVVRLDDAWLLPVIVGKGGQNIQKLQKDTECSFDILKDELAVVVSASLEEAVQEGVKSLEATIEQARKECVFIEIPESSVAKFIGKGGAGINQLASDHNVKVEKKHPSTIKISGKENCVASAQTALLAWVKEWEASHFGVTINFEEQMLSSIIGKGGQTVRSIEKETGCRIDVNRQESSATVRGGTDVTRKDAIDKIQAIIDEEEAKAAERAAAKAREAEERAREEAEAKRRQDEEDDARRQVNEATEALTLAEEAVAKARKALEDAIKEAERAKSRQEEKKNQLELVVKRNSAHDAPL